MDSRQQLYCDKCHRTMDADNFYRSNNLEKYGENNGYLHVCKKCLTMHVDNWKPETFLPLLQELDVPWIPDEWNILLQRYGQNRSRVTGTTILGRYLSKMKLNQWKDYRWKDTEWLQQMAETRLRQSLERQGFSAAEIDKAVMEGRIPVPEDNITDVDPDMIDAEKIGGVGTVVGGAVVNASGQVYTPPAEEDYGLTEEDIKMLRLKWGSAYRQDEWIFLEQLYDQMMQSYEILTAGHRDTLKLVCKASLKANQLMDIGDVDGAQKMVHAYDALMKSGKFTAVQNKTEAGEYVDSISQLVKICETDGFIPRYYVDTPQDKVDWIMRDLQEYTHTLVTEEMGLGNLIENAVRQIAIDKEKEETDSESLTDEDALDAALFGDLDDELTTDDFVEYNELQDELRQEDEKTNGS